MKKKYICLILIILAFVDLNAQNILMNELTNKYEIVFEKSNIFSKNNLFEKISEWLPIYYSDKSSTLKHIDKDKGTIIFYGKLPKKNVFYTLNIYVQENKYICKLNDFYAENELPNMIGGGYRIVKTRFEDKGLLAKKKFFQKVELELFETIDNLENFINN